MEEIRDCHYCDYGMCANSDSKVDCYVEDFGYFSHHVEDSRKEAEECEWFKYCDSFPKF